MNEKELIEGISFPKRSLDIDMIDCCELGIDGVTYETQFVAVEVYDNDVTKNSNINHSKIFKTTNRFRGTMMENITEMVETLKEQNIFREGFDYELYFDENMDNEPILCNVSNKEIVSMTGVDEDDFI